MTTAPIWCTVEHDYEWGAQEVPLILLGTIPQKFHADIVMRLAQLSQGAIIARKDNVEQDIEERIGELAGWDPFILETD